MSGDEPTHIDLFSGIGGFALAARWAGYRTVAFCEIDKYCQRVLTKNFGAEVTDADIFDFDGTRYRGCDLLTGGFPCQPFSVAGKRGGAGDVRHLWPEMCRVINEARPAWILGENVPGIIPMELDNCLSDLERIGYACRAFVIPACALDARHRRSRLWIVGRDMADARCGRFGGTNAREIQLPRGSETERRSLAGIADSYGEPALSVNEEVAELCSNTGVPDANGAGLEGQRVIPGGTGTQLSDPGDHCRWLPEPDVGRVAHGIPSRVDRLRGLGNAIVPQVAFEILRGIRQL